MVNLFAQLEVGLPVARAATIIERGIQQKGYFTWLTPPSFDGAHTIMFMLANLHDPRWAAREWAASTWKAWAPIMPRSARGTTIYRGGMEGVKR